MSTVIERPAAGSRDVAAMYARYPYPSATVGRALSYDVANLFALLCPGDDLAGRRVLDAGCGTGQRVLGMAKRYPRASFLGVDLSPASLDVARRLAERHALPNVAFAAADLLEMELGERFDVIVSTGVIHHLPDPAAGVRTLCGHLADGGVMSLWCYHPFGEFGRLAGRELLFTLWGADRTDLAAGERIMRQLRLSLPPEQYGPAAAPLDDDRLAMDADAFMHPIVHPLRFGEAMALFAGCGVDWVAVNGVNAPGTSRLLDLAQVETDARPFCLWDEDLFDEPELRERYRALSAADRLRAIELLVKPTGFTLLAGTDAALARLAPRVAGNALRTAELPAPYPRLLRV
jgi:SAM-dependent methyltransferase